MSSSTRPSGPARPQNEQREAVIRQEGPGEGADQQVPVDDGDAADSDDFAVAEEIGDVKPGSEDVARTPSQADTSRHGEPDLHTDDDSGNRGRT